MLPFKAFIELNRNSPVPVYLQISNRFINLIREGVLKPGAALPSSRELAAQLGVHRKTIVAAYDELYAQAWIISVARKSISVSHHLPELKPRTFKPVAGNSGFGSEAGFKFPTSSFLPVQTRNAGDHKIIVNDGFPDPRIAPIDELVKSYRRLFHQVSVQRKMTYGNQQGSLFLRERIREFLSDTRAIDLDEENILITRGAQMAIYLAARLILKPGSSVIVGEPNYFMANMIFEQCGAKLLRVPVDENGIDVDEIKKVCKRKTPDLIYIIPHHHHPTTVTLSAQRRMELLYFIRENNIPVIEDDYDYDFHYSSSPILPLASADHGGNVIYIGSLTKSLASSLRFGYMVAPSKFVNEAVNLRRLIDIRGDNVWEEALGTLFESGYMQNHLKRSVKLYQERRDNLSSLLLEHFPNELSFRIPDGGLALWIKFNTRYSLPSIAKKASANCLYLSDGSFYNSNGKNYNSFRMGFASLNEKEINEVVRIFKKIL